MAEGKGRTRKRPVLYGADLCIVCQKDTKQRLMKVSRDILESVDAIRHLRLKLRSDHFRDTTDRLTVILQADTHQLFSYRIIWVSPKSNDWEWLDRKEWLAKYRLHPHQCPLRKMSVYGAKHHRQTGIRASFASKRKKHHFISYTKWTSAREYWKLHSMTSFLVCLACVNDLTAADGKYHQNCLTDFDRRSKHLVNISRTSPEIVLAWLCQEPSRPISLNLADVWARYCDTSHSTQIHIPSSFQTRKNTFKEKLVHRLKSMYEIIVLHDQPRTQPRTVLVPSKFRHIPVSEMVNDETNDTERLIPSFKHDDQDTFLSMVHVALQIQGDVLSHFKPDGLEIIENQAIDSIPDSLYMFLNLLLGGQCLLEGDERDDDEKRSQT